jgi:hypothetical protein
MAMERMAVQEVLRHIPAVAEAAPAAEALELMELPEVWAAWAVITSVAPEAERLMLRVPAAAAAAEAA